MRNLSSAPALLAAALATTTLEGCSSLNPLSYAEDAYDWLTGDDSTADADDRAIHYAKTDNPSYPGDFSVDGELEKARAAALKHAEISTFVDVPKWKVWSDNDHMDVVVNPNEFEDQCFAVENAIAPAPSAEQDQTPEAAAAKQAELAKQAEQVARLAHFQKVQALAEAALRSDTIKTLWPVYQDYQNGLGPIPATLADAVAAFSQDKKTGISQDDVLCPDQKNYLLDGDQRVPVVAFKVDNQRLALPPDFWSGNLNDCDRAGILAAIKYDGGREFSTFPETSGKGTDTTNLLQSTVAGLCENPNATVTGASRYLDSYYGWKDGHYKFNPDGKLYVDGSREIKGHKVSGNFSMQPGDKTVCPSDGPLQTITLDGTKSLELQFADCTPNTDLDATLVEGDKRIASASTDVDNAPGTYQWKFCTNDDCSRYNLYSLGEKDFSWKVEKKHN